MDESKTQDECESSRQPQLVARTSLPTGVRQFFQVPTSDGETMIVVRDVFLRAQLTSNFGPNVDAICQLLNDIGPMKKSTIAKNMHKRYGWALEKTLGVLSLIDKHRCIRRYSPREVYNRNHNRKTLYSFELNMFNRYEKSCLVKSPKHCAKITTARGDTYNYFHGKGGRMADPFTMYFFETELCNVYCAPSLQRFCLHDGGGCT